MQRISFLLIGMILSPIISAQEIWQCDVIDYHFICSSSEKDLLCKNATRDQTYPLTIVFSETREQSRTISLPMPSHTPINGITLVSDEYAVSYHYDREDDFSIIATEVLGHGAKRILWVDFKEKTVLTNYLSYYSTGSHNGNLSSTEGNCKRIK